MDEVLTAVKTLTLDPQIIVLEGGRRSFWKWVGSLFEEKKEIFEGDRLLQRMRIGRAEEVFQGLESSA